MNSQRKDYVRTHVYKGSNLQQPKHMFVCLAELISRTITWNFRLLDVGAASGAFLSYALARFPAVRALGVDFDPVLVRDAQSRVTGAKFEVGDANCLAFVDNATFDVVTMTGTHSIFDDFRPSFSECIRAAADGGCVLITGIFNPYPVDAQIHWRYGAEFDEAWHPGYNLFSKKSVSTFLEKHPRVAGHEFIPFELPFDLPPGEDPIRSWTEPETNGKRVFRNGIMPLNFEILLITVSTL